MKRRYRTVELFAGTCSFSKVMKAHGHSTLTIDNDPKFNTDECINILACRDTDYKFKNTDIMWASPPCQGFSVAVIGRNWHHGGKPKTDSARLAMKLAKKTLSIIEASKPKYYFIENPLAMPRKMPFMTAFLRRTGGGTALYNILPVRRHAAKADRHLDERNMVQATRDVQTRRTVPCRSPSRIAEHTGHEERHRERAHPTCTLRANFKTDAQVI